MSKNTEDNVTKELLAANVMLLAIPTIMDELIAELEERNIYRHQLKRSIKSLLKDFEIISNAGYRAFNAKKIGSQLVTEAMDFAEQIKGCVLLEGLDGIASIIDTLMYVLVDKFKVLGTHYKIKSGILYLERMCRTFKNAITPHATLYDLTPVIQPHCTANDIKLI